MRLLPFILAIAVLMQVSAAHPIEPPREAEMFWPEFEPELFGDEGLSEVI